MKSHGTLLCGGALLAFALVSGCKEREEIKVYRVSKAQPESPVPESPAPENPGMSGMPTMGVPSADSEKPRIQWEVPSGWKTVPPSPMRYASFTVEGKSGGTADISVIVFGGDGGSDLQNVNRWRGQIGLPPVTENDLKPLIVPMKAKDGDILTVDMTGPKARLLTGWARIDGKSWFFKLTGPDAVAAGEKENFAKFLQSVQFHP